jgi:hypothetical protein
MLCCHDVVIFDASNTLQLGMKLHHMMVDLFSLHVNDTATRIIPTTANTAIFYSSASEQGEH